MKTRDRIALCLVLLTFSLTGCSAMKEGMANLNQMAAEQAAIQEQEQEASWRADVENGHYSGAVRVLFIPVELAASAKSGINEERANAMLREGFSAHEQFSLMDEKESESLKRDLHPFAGSLDAGRVNSAAARRENYGGVDADVVLRSGLRTESFTGINNKTGEIGQGIKVICWTEYMVIGDEEVTKGSFETTNIFQSEETIDEAAKSFHRTVLDDLMVEHLATKLSQAEAAAR